MEVVTWFLLKLAPRCHRVFQAALLQPNRLMWLTTEWALKMRSTKNQVYKLTIMEASNWRVGPRTTIITTLDITMPYITRAPQLSNNRISSKTRIIDITINYIAIDMKDQVRKQEEVVVKSRWLSLQTTFMIQLLGQQPIIAIQEVGRWDLQRHLRDSTQIEELKEEAKIKEISWQGLPLVRRYPLKTLIIKQLEEALSMVSLNSNSRQLQLDERHFILATIKKPSNRESGIRWTEEAKEQP